MSAALHRRLSSILVLGLSWIIALFIFRETAVSMVATWYSSSAFGHGFLVFPISICLIWTRWDRSLEGRVAPTLWGLPVLCLLTIGWLVGNMTDVLVIQQFAFIGILQTLVLTILGFRILWFLLFPVLFLSFAVPAGESLIGPMQDFTAAFTVEGVRLSGVPILWEGRLLTLASGAWYVAEACSGVRFVIAAVVLGSCFCYINFRSWIRRVACMMVFLVIPIVGNGVRVYSVIMLTHIGSTTRNGVITLLAEAIHRVLGHLFYGWLMFTVMIAALFWLASRFNDKSVSVEKPRLADTDIQQVTAGFRRLALPAILSTVLILVGPIGVYLLEASAAEGHDPGATDPDVSGAWSVVDVAVDWVPDVMGIDDEVKTTYGDGRGLLTMYAGYYGRLTGSFGLISNAIADNDQWRVLEESSAPARVDGKDVEILETVIRSETVTRVIWSWYSIGGALTSNPYYLKFLEAKGRLLGRPQFSKVMAVSVEESDHARPMLQDFLNNANMESIFNVPSDGSERSLQEERAEGGK